MTDSDYWMLEFDLTDRLQKSMRVAGISSSLLAEALGVHRNTITNYTTGRTKIDRRTLIAWAFATGVPFQWLETGQAPTSPTSGPAWSIGADQLLPRLDSNQQPSVSLLAQVRGLGDAA